MKKWTRTLCTLALLLTSAGLADASPVDEAPRERIDRGRLSFRIHCASCHGPGAQGDGPMASVLRVPPPDLARLSATHGGKFPREEVYRAIDGREPILSHGGREMPVWGLTFQSRDRDAGDVGQVEERIRDLLAFLESVQTGKAETVQEPAKAEPR